MTSVPDDPAAQPHHAEPERAFELGGSVWFQAGAHTLGGASRIALLAAIGETGSITRAAKAVGVSYKGAWDAIDAMNNVAGEPLVVRTTGGKGGGGTTLTPRARRLIDTFRAVEREHQRFLERARAAIDDFATDWDLIGRIGVKTSARNQFYGAVTQLTRGTVNDEVSLALPGGHTIVAVLTHESTDALGLRLGGAAFAWVKASSVLIAIPDAHNPPAAPLRLSARNQLRGIVRGVKRGALNAEVSLTLAGDAVVTAVVTNDDVDRLRIAEGSDAVAAFKASSVIVGVKD